MTESVAGCRGKRRSNTWRDGGPMRKRFGPSTSALAYTSSAPSIASTVRSIVRVVVGIADDERRHEHATADRLLQQQRPVRLRRLPVWVQGRVHEIATETNRCDVVLQAVTRRQPPATRRPSDHLAVEMLDNRLPLVDLASCTSPPPAQSSRHRGSSTAGTRRPVPVGGFPAASAHDGRTAPRARSRWPSPCRTSTGRA